MNKKGIEEFKRLVRPYGVEVIGKGGHMAVVKDGKRYSTLSHTGGINTYRMCIAQLVRAGVVPEELKRKKFS